MNIYFRRVMLGIFGGSTFDPSKLATPPLLWFDGQDENSITLASGSFAAGGPVSTLANKGSVGAPGNASQATGANSPAYSRAAWNGRGALTFTAASAHSLAFGAGAPVGAATSTTFVWAKAVNLSVAFKAAFCWGNPAAFQGRQIYTDNSGAANINAGNSSSEMPAGISWGAGTGKMIMHSLDAVDGQRLFVNGAQVATSSAASTATTGAGGLIGARSDGLNWDGPIGGVLVLGYLPSAGERAQIETWGTARYL